MQQIGESHAKMQTNLNPHTVRNRFLRYLKRLRQGNLQKLCFSCSLRTWILSLVACAILLWTLDLPPFGQSQVKKLTNETLLSDTSDSNVNNESQISQPIHQLDAKSLGMIYNESDRLKKEEGYKTHAFNVLISERIGLRRPLPDTRNELCDSEDYDLEQLSALNTSVIICFYNEDFHTLQRTIYTVLERTPARLLKEVILVDDHSDSK